MKNKLLILLGLFFVITLQAQKSLSKDYSYTVSEPYQVYDAAKKFYFNKDGQMLTVKPWSKYLVIQKFDATGLKLTSLKEYNDLPKNYVVEGMEELQGKYYFFYSSWSGKKTKHERLYYREIDFEKGEFIGEPKKLIDVSGKLAGASLLASTTGSPFGIGMGVVDKFHFMVSKDESKILVQYRKKPKIKSDKKSHDIIGVSVYDTTLEKIWSNEYRMPYTERRMNVLDFAVDTESKGYMLAKVFHDDSNKDKKKRKDTESNYHIELFRLLNGTDKIIKTKVELDESFINGISLFENEQGEMICAGFYNKGIHDKTGMSLLSKEFKANSADGLFVCKLSKEGTLTDKKTYEIPLDILNQYVSNRTKKKNKKKDSKGKAEFEYLKLKDLLFNKDGSLILIGEQTYTIRHRTSKGRVYYTFHNNDILITKINPKGDLAWMKKIPKRQKGAPKMGQVYDTSKTFQGGMSYSHFYTNGYHHLIYLDNVKNINLSLDKIPALHSDGSGGYLTSYKINDVTGDVSKGSILDTKNVKPKLAVYQFSNNRVVKTAKNEFIVEVYKKKKEDVLIKVKIKG